MDFLTEILKGLLSVAVVMGFYYFGKGHGIRSNARKLVQQGKMIAVAAASSVLLVFFGYNAHKYPIKLWITYMLTVTILTVLIGLADGWKVRQRINNKP